jgi:hypothetical protein
MDDFTGAARPLGNQDRRARRTIIVHFPAGHNRHVETEQIPDTAFVPLSNELIRNTVAALSHASRDTRNCHLDIIQPEVE